MDFELFFHSKNWLALNRQNFKSFLLIFTAFALIGAAFFNARALGMADKLPQHSFTRAQMSIGISLSKLTYGAEGYLLYTPVIKSLVENGFSGDQILKPGQINTAIHAARSLQLGGGPVASEKDWGDDKGYSDFTTLAFRLFGFQIEALFSLYFVMLGVAVTLFALRFYDDRWALSILVTFLVAHLLVIQILPNSGVTSVVHDSRFLPAVSSISMFHWLLAIARSNRRAMLEVPLLIAQAAIIVFVLNCRSSSIWQVWAVAFTLVMVGFLSLRRGDMKRMWSFVLWLGILVSGVTSLNLYKGLTYDARYRSENGTRAHVVWHNVYMGLGFHPDAIWKYDLLPDDSTVYRHALNYLEQNPEVVKSLGFEGTKLYEPVFVPMGWGGYDKAVKTMFFTFARNDPKYVAEAFLLYKPMLLLEEFAWQVGLKREFPDWVKINPVHGPAGDLRIKFLSLPLLFSMFLTFWACRGGHGRSGGSANVLCFGLGVTFSLIPSIAVGPFYYELPVVFIIFSMVLIILISALIDSGLRWKLRSYEAPR